MYPLKRILVGLDLSEMDVPLIKYASLLAQASGAEKIYFVNIVRSTNIPEAVQQEFPDLMKNAIKERKKQLDKEVKEHFKPANHVDFEYIVDQGVAFRKILRLSNKYSIDAILVGRKKELEGSGVVTQRLARRAKCSLLIVPEDSHPEIKKILVASDFSDYSVIAMEEAISIAENYKEDAEIICQNVYTVPVGYHYTGKSYKEFSKIMEEHARRDYEMFIKKIDTKGLKITPVYSLDKDDNPINDIFRMAKKKDVDCLVVGAKGRTATTALFLGSMAERLINLDLYTPLMVVRPKNKSAGILEYLKEI